MFKRFKGWLYMRMLLSNTVNVLECSDAREVEVLIAALRNSNSSVRKRAAFKFRKLKGTHAVEPLIAALRDTEHTVRHLAATALEQLRDARAVEPLVVGLRDSNKLVRHAAANALGTLGDARAVEPLIAVLQDSDASVRVAAAEALGRLGDDRATKPLIAAQRDSFVTVRSTAAHALERLGDARAAEPPSAAPQSAFEKAIDCFEETAPKSAAEKTAAMRQLIEELTGFKFKRPGGAATMQTANVINVRTREDMLDRVAYYRGWMDEGTFPKLHLYVLDATTPDVRFPHVIILTGPKNENIALLSDKAYEVRVKKYVSKGRLEMADAYQDFDIPGFTNAKRLNGDFSDKILEKGYYSVSLVLEPRDETTPSSQLQNDPTTRPTVESVTHSIESAGGAVKRRDDEPDRGGLAVTVINVAILPHLTLLSDIQVLDLSNSSVSDSSLAHLASLKSLDKLHLNQTGITDAGMKQLAHLTSLRELGLSGTLVSDAGLQQLVLLKALRLLWIRDTPITKAGLDAFARAAGVMVISDMYGMHPS